MTPMQKLVAYLDKRHDTLTARLESPTCIDRGEQEAAPVFPLATALPCRLSL